MINRHKAFRIGTEFDMTAARSERRELFQIAKPFDTGMRLQTNYRI
jgi:hypothetical protein